MRRPPRSTPQGEHRPVLLDEVLRALAPQPGEVVADCTLGWAGHAVELLRRVGPTGRLIGLDLDGDNLPRAQERLAEVGHPFTLRHTTFAALPTVLGEEGVPQIDVILADLGMSSMQVDDAERGFSYARDGPLDMRMDRSRGRTAAEVLATIGVEELAAALRDLGDELQPERVAAAIVAARQGGGLQRTGDLARVVLGVYQPGKGDERWRPRQSPGKWKSHPAARTFQALRILVNRELAGLEQLLRMAPLCLRPGGRIGVISFHSGEDRLVKSAFRTGEQSGVYSHISDEPIRASEQEKRENPRSRSAKLRWARRTT